MMKTNRAYFTGNGDQNQTLVVIFLRGGADGLSLIPPIEDDLYYKVRPLTAVVKKDSLPLSNLFGLNPFLKALKPIYDEGDLAVVHGAGSEDNSRSHFKAQDLMEHGGLTAGGWLGRFLRYGSFSSQQSALSAVALGETLPESLRGAPSVSVIQSIEEFDLEISSPAFLKDLHHLYKKEKSSLRNRATDTLHAIQRIEDLQKIPYQPAHDAKYKDNRFSFHLQQVAQLIKAKVGLQAATIDLNGWDSHFTQTTLITPLMTQLSEGLFAFYKDLGAWLENVTVVVMTEFGRRVKENSSFGTDHGRASTMFLIGKKIHGGRVIGPWQGLKEELLEGPGDLPVVNNYRNVLAPVLKHHGAGDAFDKIFPHYQLDPLSLYG